jgi:transcriptional regulator with XRE-family HTH domain
VTERTIPATVPLHPEPLPQPAPGHGLDGDARRRTDELRRRELAAFLRSRRERIMPEQVGLPPGGRRRTPGLRREEVAQLAGVGVTWYTWLEQGRDISVSEQVLTAVARTLMLDPHEQAHLFTLAGSAAPVPLPDGEPVPPAVRVLLDTLEPLPASVQNARYDILAFNRTYGGMMVDLDTMPYEDRNTLWLLFTNPVWRAAVVDWEDAVSRMVAQYRAAMAEHVAEPSWKCLVKRLRQASPEFAALWERHDVRPPENRTKQFRHPRVGLIRFDYTNLWLAPQRGTRLITYTPADEESWSRLRALRDLIAKGEGPEAP